MKECVYCAASADDNQITCLKCGRGSFRAHRESIRFGGPGKEEAPGLEQLPIALFISHAWDQSQRYYDLIEVLDRAYGREWRDRSIPAAKAFEVAKEPHVQSEQLKTLIARKALELDELMQNHMRQRQEQLKRETGATESVVVDDTWLRMNTERTNLLRHLESPESSLESIYHRRKGQPVHDTPKIHAIREHPYLALSIHKSVSSADCVLVIATPGSVFKYWMEFEIDVALFERKPILGLADNTDGEDLPLAPEYLNSGIARVPWDAETIKEEINSRLDG